MGHAACHSDPVRKTVVCLVPIAGEISLEQIPQEFLRVVPGAGPLVLEEDHLRGAAGFIREIDPHPVLGGALLVRLIDHLDPSLVSV